MIYLSPVFEDIEIETLIEGLTIQCAEEHGDEFFESAVSLIIID